MFIGNTFREECSVLSLLYYFAGENIALGQPATQSDTLWDFGPGKGGKYTTLSLSYLVPVLKGRGGVL